MQIPRRIITNATTEYYGFADASEKAKLPGIIVPKGICHSRHIGASEACNVLPRDIEQLARDVFNFFSKSSKRQAQFQQFQTFFNIDIKKMLHPSQTRWLSLTAVIRRMIGNWAP